MDNTHELYSDGVQHLLLSYMLTDPTSFAMSQNIIKANYFDNKLRKAARFILEYADKQRAVPNFDMVKTMGGLDLAPFQDHSRHRDWYLETIEGFCRYKAMESVVIEGPDLLAKGQGGEIERRIKEAQTISLMRDIGTDYFADPLARLERMKDRSSYISTGWATLDEKLLGGFTKGALNVFAGGSGSGKSLFLQNLALNWAFAGMNVIYITLELAEDLVALRLDAMVSGIGTKQVFSDMNKVAAAIRMQGLKGGGSLTVKKLPEAGTTTNVLRAYVKEYEIKTGKRVDALVVDYLDLMFPNNQAIDVTNAFAKDKYTSEELRGLAGELDVLCATASQLNRQSVEAVDFDHSHIAGGISKINTSDNVFGIFTNPTKRENGVYDLQFLKTRSSSAVGSKISLAYDPISMRITDMGEDAEILKAKSAQAVAQELKSNIKGMPQDKAPPAAPAASGAPNDVMALMSRIQRKNEN